MAASSSQGCLVQAAAAVAMEEVSSVRARPLPGLSLRKVQMK